MRITLRIKALTRFSIISIEKFLYPLFNGILITISNLRRKVILLPLLYEQIQSIWSIYFLLKFLSSIKNISLCQSITNFKKGIFLNNLFESKFKMHSYFFQGFLQFTEQTYFTIFSVRFQIKNYEKNSHRIRDWSFQLKFCFI